MKQRGPVMHVIFVCWLTLSIVAAGLFSGCVSDHQTSSSTGGSGAAVQAGTGGGGEGDREIGVMVYVGDKSVRGYRPRPMLVTAVHKPQKAKFAATDVHCHWGPDEDPAALIRAMDERGIQRAVNLSGDRGDKLDQMLAKFHGHDPQRFIIFCSPDFKRIDEPNFSAAMAAFVRQAYAKGARGVKIYKNLGLGVRDAAGRRIAVDDPRLDGIWATAGERGIPVLIHTADPAAFFTTVDECNERWMQLNRHPRWSFHGPQFPSREALLEERNRMIARHPNTIFIGAHVGNNAEDLASVTKVMDANPNFYVDISGRVAELGRQPYSARRFFIEHQDRILYGTDRFPGKKSQPRYRIYFRFLETADEYFDYYDHDFPPTGEWKIYGLYLPDDVLRKVYHENADRIFGAINE